MNRRRFRAIALVALVGGLMVARGAAHHSFAMYDTSVTKTLTGKLIRFIPGANHAQLIFELLTDEGQPVLDEKGEPVVWGVETGPAWRLARQGVTVKTFPIGTILTVTLNPLRNGRPFGALRDEDGVLIGCGTEMPPGGCNEKTGTVYIRGRGRPTAANRD
jgi:hypothetical protein